MAEGTGLLNRRSSYRATEGSNPSLSANNPAPAGFLLFGEGFEAVRRVRKRPGGRFDDERSEEAPGGGERSESIPPSPQQTPHQRGFCYSGRGSKPAGGFENDPEGVSTTSGARKPPEGVREANQSLPLRNKPRISGFFAIPGGVRSRKEGSKTTRRAFRRGAKRGSPRRGFAKRINPSLSATNPASAGFLLFGEGFEAERRVHNSSRELVP